MVSLGFTPVQMNDRGLGGSADMETSGMPDIAQGAEATKILERLAAISASYGTKMKIANGRAELVLT